MNGCAIPGYIEAVRREQKFRAAAFCGLPEFIAGIECKPLTLERIDWLIAMQNPFLVGGECSVAAICQFLWVVNPDFTTDKKDAESFTKRILDLDYVLAREEIKSYLEEAYIDGPDGEPDTPFYSQSAGAIRAMSDAPFNWTIDETRSCPIKILHQLMRANARSKGAILKNPISDKICSDWLVAIQSALDAGEIKPEDLEGLNNAKR